MACHPKLACKAGEHNGLPSEARARDRRAKDGPPGDRTRDTVIKSRARWLVSDGLARIFLDILASRLDPSGPAIPRLDSPRSHCGPPHILLGIAGKDDCIWRRCGFRRRKRKGRQKNEAFKSMEKILENRCSGPVSLRTFNGACAASIDADARAFGRREPMNSASTALDSGSRGRWFKSSRNTAKGRAARTNGLFFFSCGYICFGTRSSAAWRSAATSAGN
jgi:hypothetical protein